MSWIPSRSFSTPRGLCTRNHRAAWPCHLPSNTREGGATYLSKARSWWRPNETTRLAVKPLSMLQATTGTWVVEHTTLWFYLLFIPVWLLMVVSGDRLYRVQQHAVKTARQQNAGFRQMRRTPPPSGSAPVLPTIRRGWPNCVTKV